MANVNSITSNSYGSTQSLYGNKNILTGLASGMDTETMIQNSISGYQTKIATLQQSQTKIEWKQDAYREITDQMNDIMQKYTSYTSKTNLASNAFFTSASKVETQGTNAAAISATGQSKSDIQINSVTKLATATRYAVDAKSLDVRAADKAVGKAIAWDMQKEIGQINGSITLKYGSQDIELNFGEDDIDIKTPGKLKEAIEKKLADVTVKAKDGSSVKANTLIRVKTNGTAFSFEVNRSNSDDDGSSVYIDSVSGNVTSMLGAHRPSSSLTEEKIKNTGFTVPDMDALVKTPTMAEYLKDKKVDITLDGTTKTIKIGNLTGVTVDTSEFDDQIATLEAKEDRTIDENMQLSTLRQNRQDKINGAMTEALKNDLQASINKAFGAGRVTVGVEDGALKFDVADGSSVKVASGAGEALGLGKGGVSNYFNTENTLGDLLTSDELDSFRIKGNESEFEGTAYFDASGNRLLRSGDKYYRANESGGYLLKDGAKVAAELDHEARTDADGNLYMKFYDSEDYYRVDEKGNYLYDMTINGKSFGKFTKDTTFESVLTAINSNADVGVTVNYSNLTGKFVFNARETGESGKISFDSALAKKLFEAGGVAAEDSAGFVKGSDAIMNVTVNGEELTLRRATNTVSMDGMTVTLKNTFNTDGTGEAVTFKTSSDSDKVVDTVKAFVEDVNKLMKSVHDAYATAPLKKSTSKKSSSGYEPLTEEDKADMSENAINAYEEKAKTGLLFGDTDLSQLYSSLLSTVQAYGTDRMDMEAIGLTTTYSNGVTQFSLDEDKLRNALDSDPDKVRNVFAKTKDGGAKTNGLMASFKTTMTNYASTSLGSPGILVRKAGTKLSAISLMNNNLQKQIDNINAQIEQWQTRLSDRVDYYTRQFTQLEKLMSTMNNQSSMLADLMGG